MNKKKILSCIIVNWFFVIFTLGFFSVNAEYSYNISDDYMYNILETQYEKDFYNSLYEVCTKVDNSTADYKYTPYVKCDRRMDYKKAREIGLIFLHSHPEFFWIGSGTVYSQLHGFCFELVDSFESGSERQLAKVNIIEAEKEYIDNALEYTNDYDKAKYLHDALLKNVSYEPGEWDQTIASVFLQKKTVCAGYSKAYEFLCREVGIDSVVVTSFTHAWNVVRIGEYWFNVDVTNDVSTYMFFLISDKKLHEIDEYFELKELYTDNSDNTYELYLHDIDYLTYTDYYDNFPVCDYNYKDISAVSGDANLDGILNIRDCAYIAGKIADNRINELPECADFNEDNVVNIRDASAIAKFLASNNFA